jgi:hypothetical protein
MIAALLSKTIDKFFTETWRKPLKIAGQNVDPKKPGIVSRLQALFCAQPSRAEPISGVRRPPRAPEAAVAHSGRTPRKKNRIVQIGTTRSRFFKILGSVRAPSELHHNLFTTVKRSSLEL